ncbi:MAG TPA: chemotaxis protein [Burkholderiales bacterium]|nr:chemotaxis protein [Burkholderiales bacterium]
MAVWASALKAVLPYVTNIVTAAIPAFTSRMGQDRSAEVTAQQIAELQGAATHNAESVKVLAEQLQRTVSAIEQGAANVDRALRRLRLLAAASMLVAVIALCAALFVVVG